MDKKDTLLSRQVRRTGIKDQEQTTGQRMRPGLSQLSTQTQRTEEETHFKNITTVVGLWVPLSLWDHLQKRPVTQSAPQWTVTTDGDKTTLVAGWLADKRWATCAGHEMCPMVC